MTAFLTATQAILGHWFTASLIIAIAVMVALAAWSDRRAQRAQRARDEIERNAYAQDAAWRRERAQIPVQRNRKSPASQRVVPYVQPKPDVNDAGFWSFGGER